MSRRVFEYFFEPADLEPFFSELPPSLVGNSSRQKRNDPTAKGPREMPAPNDNKQPIVEERVLGKSVAETKPEDRAREPSEEPTASPEARKSSESVPSSDANLDERSPSNNDLASTETTTRPSELADSNRTRIRRLLSVHALGQYVFCVRSAILSAEKGDQRDIDEPPLRLTFLPNFDRERIEEMLSAKITQLGFFLLYGVCLIILMKMGLTHKNRWVFYPSLVGFLGLGAWSFDVFVRIVALASRRRAAMRAEAREPEPNITSIEHVNWWSMLKAEFEPISYERQIQHPELPLEGSPWRVLQRGSRRIPVIKSGSRKLGNRKGELYPKHQVRLVAYALLLESMGQFEVPYGLVFPVDSPHGLAFPITDELRERAVRLLYEFEQKLVESQRHGIQPELPNNRNHCRNCDYGKPVLTTPKEVEQALKSGRQLVILRHGSGQVYRCECADRFGSAPPHYLTIKKGLTAEVR